MLTTDATPNRGRLSVFATPALALLFLLSPAAPEARAQEGPGAETPPEPALSGRPRAGRNLIMRLNLTRDQMAQLREIRRQSEQEARPLARRLRMARRALDEAIYADKVDESLIEERSREVAAAQAALVRLRALTELKVRRALTAEQLQSFRELRQRARTRQRLQRRMLRRPPEAP